MKLNLLPTYVSKEKSNRAALLASIAVFVVFVLASIFLYSKAQTDLGNSQVGIAEARGKAEEAKKTGDLADVVMQNATTLLRNKNLADAMQTHIGTYPTLYDEMKRYVPSFYRVNSMSAASTGANETTVTMVGVLDTPQQYADLMLALLRINGVTSVSRAGFNNNAPYVPAPTPDDQYGKPHKPGLAPIPDDPLKRLEYFQGQGRIVGYQNVSGFGSGVPGLRGPMPDASQVTVTVVLSGPTRDIQSPDPRATLAGASGGTGGPGGGGPGATGGQLPAGGAGPRKGFQGGGAPASPPTTPTTTPTTTPSNPPAKKGKRGATDDTTD